MDSYTFDLEDECVCGVPVNNDQDTYPHVVKVETFRANDGWYEEVIVTMACGHVHAEEHDG